MLLRRNDQRRANADGTRQAVRTVIGALSTALLLAAVFFVIPGLARAGEVDLGLNYASATGLATTDIRTIVGNILKAFFALLGLVAVCLILYAGILWMTSSGNEEKISQAKKIMINAVIGLAIMMAAYAITAFIFRALSGERDAAGEGGGGTTFTPSIHCRNCGPDEMGKILEYHYPESGQTDVPRNTKLAITFKKPLVLSTVFQNYDDKGTYVTSDDRMCDPARTDGVCDLTCNQADGDKNACTALSHCTYNEDISKCLLNPRLNTVNIKILPNEGLGDVAVTADKDADYDKRYPDDAGGLLLTPAPFAVATVVNTVFDPNNKGQTLVIKPADSIGSASVDVNYRVALRGGPNGILVWEDARMPGTACARQSSSETAAKCVQAFSTMRADGSYFWSFTTGTALDTTPPQVTFAGPRLTLRPEDRPIVRNQIVQVYFDEPIDPSTATGKTGSGGFNWVNVRAKCIPNTDCPWNQAALTAIEGSWEISNRYRTLEFIPSTACEGISENSCGEPVFCLPKNVELQVFVKPSSFDAANPPAGIFPPNGVTDMVGNSFDGNKNGTAQGPTPGVWPPASSPLPYDYNQYFTSPPADRSGFSDTAYWTYNVNDEVDLETPVVTNIVPPSVNDPAPPAAGDAWSAGPSEFPADEDVVVTWSKTMMSSSMINGTTVYILSRELEKQPGSPECVVGKTSESECPRTLLAQPTITIDVGDGPVVDPVTGRDVTVMKLHHRTFATTNDLGWSENEATNVLTDIVPVYLPVIRHRVKDDRQNCFYPSQGFDCEDGSGEQTSPDIPVNSGGRPSCLNREPGGSFNWQP